MGMGWLKLAAFLYTMTYVFSLESQSHLRISNNGYELLVVGVHDSVPDNPATLQKLKTIFTKASKVLYTATRKRAYFKKIFFILPSSWASRPEYKPSTSVTLTGADIIFSAPRGATRRSFSHTRSYVGCGHQAFHTQLTTDVLNSNHPLAQSSPEKYIIHEFATLRYGVFEEYPNPGENEFYFSTAYGRLDPVRCTVGLRGIIKSSKGYCLFTSIDPETGEFPPGATRHRAFFRKVFILIPSTWSSSLADRDSTSVNLQEADIILSNPSAVTKRSYRRTRSYAGCGHPGIHIQLRTDVLLNNGHPLVQHKPEKFLVHEFAKYRYGVFEEYPNPGENQFYFSTTFGRADPVRCTTGLIGRIVKRTSSGIQICSYDTVDPVTGEFPEGCSYYPYPSHNKGTASMMDYSYIQEIQDFCDDDHTPGHFSHNVEPPNRHNRLCSHRSTWDVISNTPDFKSANSPTTLSDSQLTPQFIIFRAPHRRRRRLAVVLDSPQEIHKRMRLHQAVDHFLREGFNTDTRVAIIHNDANSVKPRRLRSRRSSVIKSVLQNIDHFSPSFSKTRSRIQRGVQLLRKSNLTTSGMEQHLIWITCDNQSNVEERDLQNLADLDITPHIIHCGDDGIKHLEEVRVREDEVPIRTNAWVKVFHEYSPPRIGVYAEVMYGGHPVVNANVTAHVFQNNRKVVVIPLRDTGGGVDIMKEDGIYSNFFTEMDSHGSHYVEVVIEDAYKQSEIHKTYEIQIPGEEGISPDDLDMFHAPRLEHQTEKVKLNHGLKRSTSSGQFDIDHRWDLKPQTDQYPPARIIDLTVDKVDRKNRVVYLSWTSTGEDLDTGRASFYEIRYHTNGTALLHSPEDAELVKKVDVLMGSLDRPREAGQIEHVAVQFPRTMKWVAIMLRSVDKSINVGDFSNMVTTFFEL
ncbi:calcium-activated chloride channel regulator 4-like [Saccostrea echinata]|uniref:calcium-activated chloride channel regulator 4-like n=1 Tax=Saccostrea echinata TaxID=191078 RepID=UPI002A8388DA|nr:calcium-activated chloride channel regulator 4-like [Saccostrea echinata]